MASTWPSEQCQWLASTAARLSSPSAAWPRVMVASHPMAKRIPHMRPFQIFLGAKSGRWALAPLLLDELLRRPTLIVEVPGVERPPSGTRAGEMPWSVQAWTRRTARGPHAACTCSMREADGSACTCSMREADGSARLSRWGAEAGRARAQARAQARVQAERRRSAGHPYRARALELWNPRRLDGAVD